MTAIQLKMKSLPLSVLAIAQDMRKDPAKWTRISTLMQLGSAFTVIYNFGFATEQNFHQINYDWPMGFGLPLSSEVSFKLGGLCQCLQLLYISSSVITLLSLAVLPVFITWTIFTWRQGYAVFLSLGRGGTPYNALGYTIVSFKAMFGINPLAVPDIPKGLSPWDGFLKALPLRPGPRPKVLGIAPQRQIEEKVNWQSVQMAINKFIGNSSSMEQNISFLEQHGQAMFPRDKCSARLSEKLFGFEIGHVHEYDGSLHLNLHPRDIATVLASGWGERHPLARGDKFWFAYFRDFWQYLGYEGARPPVSVNWTLIYAPRTEEERQVVLSIVKAAGEWMTGVESE